NRRRIRGDPQPRRAEGGAGLAQGAVQGRSMNHFHQALVAFVAASAGLATCAPSSAQDNFFAGKTIQLVIGFDVGGGYDLYARTVARYWSRHIPGNPVMVPQNMPGAGTRTAGNYLYSVAPKDGTAIGTLVQSTPVDQALGEPGIRFDSAKFNWLGNPIAD